MLFLQDQVANNTYFRMPHNQVAEADTFSMYKKGLDKFMDNRPVQKYQKEAKLCPLTSLIQQSCWGGTRGWTAECGQVHVCSPDSSSG